METSVMRWRSMRASTRPAGLTAALFAAALALVISTAPASSTPTYARLQSAPSTTAFAFGITRRVRRDRGFLEGASAQGGAHRTHLELMMGGASRAKKPQTTTSSGFMPAIKAVGSYRNEQSRRGAVEMATTKLAAEAHDGGDDFAGNGSPSEEAVAVVDGDGDSNAYGGTRPTDSTVLPSVHPDLVSDILQMAGDSVTMSEIVNQSAAAAAPASPTCHSAAEDVVDLIAAVGTPVGRVSRQAGFSRHMTSAKATTFIPMEVRSSPASAYEGPRGDLTNSGVKAAPHKLNVLPQVTEDDGTAVEDKSAMTLSRDAVDITRPASPTVVELPTTPLMKPEPVYGEKNSRAMVTELVAFTLPLLIVWLSNPIMSLVDTAVVGARSSVELAALGPGTSVCDNVAYMCGFLAQVTTNLVASALADGDEQKADRATVTGMVLATGVGLAVTHGLLRHGRALLELFLGGNSAVSSVLPYSCEYVYIRALGFVAVTVSMVLQGTYLAKKDIATPIKSVAGSSVVNLVLDCWMVFGLGMGIKGAALSTTLAQWAGLLYLLKQILPGMRRSGALSYMPTKGEVKKFLSLGLPTCLALSGQVATCIGVTAAASSCDTISLAAHQVIYGVFVLFCPIGEAVSQTVQSYLPGFTVRRPPMANGKPNRTLTFGKSAVRMLKVVSVVALGLGAINAVLATLLTSTLPCIFTRDTAVSESMRSVSALCGLNLAFHGLTAALQGTMMATRDVFSMAAIYTVCSTLFCTRFVMMRLQPALQLTSVWQTFAVYQVTRCTLFAANVVWSHRESLTGHFFAEEGAAVESALEAAAKIGHAEKKLALASPSLGSVDMRRARPSLFAVGGRARPSTRKKVSKFLSRERLKYNGPPEKRSRQSE